MRDDISEPQHWRSSGRSGAGMGNSWAGRRHRSELQAELVDAAFEEETGPILPVRASRRDLPSQLPTDEPRRKPDIVESISAQLKMLEIQREQLQKLLEDAQG